MTEEVRVVRYTTKKTQPKAKQHCIRLGGRLMEVRTQHDYDKAVEKRERNTVWIGVKKNNGKWKWLSNGERMKMNQFWIPGRPDSSAECATLRGAGFGDDRCDKTFQYLCEFY